MTREEFLEKFQDILQTEDELSFGMSLDDIEEWDSLAKLATVAFLDQNFNVKVVFDDFQNLKTIDDVAKKAGI
ncbi:acyl carrier protein [Gilliamella sp. W8126]|uniref:Acyl carrier protein n=1 Tax=Gilliamella apis TaxID=1970738 RepID=A0A2V4DSZ9_9GAMM|nr:MULTISPECIES: acyl carrier protein [Gilliamella]MBI0005858.1 acyl carrier protein [Gilliamella sp. W8126]PXY91526.1 acyl carrier protein [Gilliamella apis]WLS93481.1 hypothetical protein RAM17_09520 [Gilliamella apis]WLT06059.1 hypothetical protein RAM11_09310 [Gilliamella apis]